MIPIFEVIYLNIKAFIESNKETAFRMLRELCAIPAPSGFEEKRAEYCRSFLENIGAKGVYIDGALNVNFPLNCEGSDEITAICAHTDTVFPDMEPLPYREDDEKIYSPGVADDTESVVVLLLTVKFFLENGIVPEKGILFSCNSSEEGLGNLKGTRELFRAYEGRIKTFITYDNHINCIANRCVGSHRYRVEVKTEGGHSFSAFGKENAIANLSDIISEIYKLRVPEKDGAKTTYNVGIIEGGTSVNTIAQSASMLCEYRSDDKACLAIMEKAFSDIFRQAEEKENVEVIVTRVGDRPCSAVDAALISEIEEKLVPIIEEEAGEKVTFNSLSTDCNIPLSLGVPALCIGTNRHGGAHTREEWLLKASLAPGLAISIKTALKLSEVEL